MKIEFSTNGFKVVQTGMVLLYDKNSDLTMRLTADNGFSFQIVLQFITDTNSEQRLDKEVNGNTVIFKCINFKSLGTGTLEPLSLATIDDKELFFHFWSYHMADEGPRKVEYTFLERE